MYLLTLLSSQQLVILLVLQLRSAVVAVNACSNLNLKLHAVNGQQTSHSRNLLSEMSAEYSSRAGSNVLSAGHQSIRPSDLNDYRIDSRKNVLRKPNTGVVDFSKYPRNNIGTPSQIPPVGTYNVSYDPPVDSFHTI